MSSSNDRSKKKCTDIIRDKKANLFLLKKKKKKLDQNFVGFEVFRSPSLTGNIMYIVSSPHAYVPVSSRISTHRLLLLLYSTRIRPVYVLVLNLHIVIVILLLLPLLPVPQPSRPTSYYSSAHRRPGISRIANSHEL